MDVGPHIPHLQRWAPESRELLQSSTDTTSASGQKLRDRFVECKLLILHYQDLLINQRFSLPAARMLSQRYEHPHTALLVIEGRCAAHEPTLLRMTVCVGNAHQNVTTSSLCPHTGHS